MAVAILAMEWFYTKTFIIYNATNWLKESCKYPILFCNEDSTVITSSKSVSFNFVYYSSDCNTLFHLFCAEVERQFVISRQQREKRAAITYELEKEKHVLRQMQGNINIHTISEQERPWNICNTKRFLSSVIHVNMVNPWTRKMSCFWIMAYHLWQWILS